MNVYCKQVDCNTPMVVNQTVISEDYDGIKLIYKCFMCHNTIEIYINNVDIIVTNGIDRL